MSGAKNRRQLNLNQSLLPDNVRKLENNETFQFDCHSGVECFTDCCRQLELALTPYDVLRLKKSLGLTSSDFLDQYAIIEKLEEDIFPQVFLAMIDDGQASCPFVSAKGCGLYADRPGACRTYPLGRGAVQSPDGSCQDFHVLLSEPHCKGFFQKTTQTAEQWNLNQELTLYNSINDEVMGILQHQQVKAGFRPDQQQIDKFILALYNLDEFRPLVLDSNFQSGLSLSADERTSFMSDDEALLRFSIQWLEHELFGK